MNYKIIVTGSILGGNIAEWLTYKEKRVSHCESFNTVCNNYL